MRLIIGWLASEARSRAFIAAKQKRLQGDLLSWADRRTPSRPKPTRHRPAPRAIARPTSLRQNYPQKAAAIAARASYGLMHCSTRTVGRPPRAIYFALLRFEGGRVTHIRDYRHARYAVELLQLEPLNVAR